MRLRIAALLAGVSLSAVAAHAQDAAWNNPATVAGPVAGTFDLNANANWTPATVPTGTALFGVSSTPNISFSASTTIGGWTFNPGASNYTFTNGHTLIFNGAGIVINGGSATIINNDIVGFRGSSTAGSATITNNFLVTFTNSSTAGSATITNDNASTLSFFVSSTAGSATITTNNGGDTAFFNNSTGGNARFIVNAGGMVDFSNSTGPLNNNQLSAGSIEGAGSINLGSNNLTVGGNNLSTTFAGSLQDFGVGGSLTKVGSGTLTLTGINTNTGTTDVSGGTLLVNGSIAASSLARVNNGGTLGGAGTVGNTQVNSGGTFAPGSGTPGTSIAVGGNLAFQSGAFYLVQVNPATASFAYVTGTASLAGTVEAVLAPGSYTRQSYQILHATGGLGGTTFNAATVSPPNFAATLSYMPTDVFLNLTAALGSGTPLNQNQLSVANAINAFFNNGGTLPPGFFALFNLAGPNLANALTLLSGEVATGAQQGAFQLMNRFMGVMLDPFAAGRAGIGGMDGGGTAFASDELPEDVALAYARVLGTPASKATPFDQRWSVWGAAYGGYNRTSGDPLNVGSHDLTARTAGVAAGMDYQIRPGTVVGFALAGGGTSWSLAQNLGSGRSDAFQAGVYGTTHYGPVYLAAALAYTEYWMSTDRYAFAGDYVTAKFNAQSVGGRSEAGYRIPVASWGVTPYAAVQAQIFLTPAYSENDVSGGGFGLTYDAGNATDTRSELGARFDRQFLLNWSAVLALRGKIAWAHDWISDPSLVPGFEALPGASFIVTGATPAKNSALTSAGAELRLINGVSVLAKFDGDFATHSQTYAGTGTVRYVW
jgi:outer membrane autotransporter protein